MNLKKSILALCVLASACWSCTPKRSMMNMVATMEVKEPIEGVCNNKEVYVMLPIQGNGQVAAVTKKTKEEIVEQLNEEVKFLKGKTDYNDKGMVNLVINCTGELVRCRIDNKTQNPELDEQIVAVFAKLKIWTPASLHGRAVDSVELYSFTITNGKISL